MDDEQLSRYQLAEAARIIDALGEEAQDIKGVLAELGIDVQDAEYVASERATRLYAVLTGQGKPQDFQQLGIVRVDPVEIAKYVALWMDGMSVGLKAKQMQERDRRARET